MLGPGVESAWKMTSEPDSWCAIDLTPRWAPGSFSSASTLRSLSHLLLSSGGTANGPSDPAVEKDMMVCYLIHIKHFIININNTRSLWSLLDVYRNIQIIVHQLELHDCNITMCKINTSKLAAWNLIISKLIQGQYFQRSLIHIF